MNGFVSPDSNILYFTLWRKFSFNLFQSWYACCLGLYKTIQGTSMRKSCLCLYHHHLLWYDYPHSLFSWYRTVCMHYPILKLIFNLGISVCFTSNIFRAPQGPWQSSQKYFPLWSASLHSLIGSGGATTAVSVDIMVSDIKSTLTFPKSIHCRLKEPGIQTHIINNPPLNLRVHPKANLEVLFEAFSRLTYFYLAVSNRFWFPLTKWPSWSHQNSSFSTW